MKIFQTLINKYKDAKRRSLHKKQFREMLLLAVSDGTLTQEEIKELDKKKNELGLAEEDIKGMRMEAFETAFTAIKAGGQISTVGEQKLKTIQMYLLIADNEIQNQKREIARLADSEIQNLKRLRLLNEIQRGNLPTISVTNIIMQKDEKAHWIEPASLLEERVLRRRFEGGSQGFSFRITKGVSYRVGGFRGHSVAETGMVVSSYGELIITNKRIIFSGDRKSFAVKLDKIFDIQFFSDGLQFSENNRIKPKFVNFMQEGNIYIIEAILSYVLKCITGEGVGNNALGELVGAERSLDEDGFAYAERGVNKGESGDYVGAIQDYDKAIELEPDDANFYYLRGSAKLKSGEHIGAIQDFNKVIEIAPKEEAWVYSTRALAKESLGDHVGAIKDLNKAIELEPEGTTAYFNRGVIKGILEDSIGEIQDYDRAIELDPQYASAYFNRGVSKDQLGDKQGALMDLSKAGELGCTKAYEVIEKLQQK